MSKEKDNSTIAEEEKPEVLEEPEEVKVSVRKTFKEFLKQSGLSLIFGGIAIIIIILGVILYYTAAGPITQKTGLWLGIAGVVIFMLTTIFGFERIE